MFLRGVSPPLRMERNKCAERAGFRCVRALGQKSYWAPIYAGGLKPTVFRFLEINSEQFRGSICILLKLDFVYYSFKRKMH